jgi:hypothetical protein
MKITSETTYLHTVLYKQVGSCEYGNKPSGSQKGRKFLD